MAREVDFGSVTGEIQNSRAEQPQVSGGPGLRAHLSKPRVFGDAVEGGRRHRKLAERMLSERRRCLRHEGKLASDRLGRRGLRRGNLDDELNLGQQRDSAAASQHRQRLDTARSLA